MRKRYILLIMALLMVMSQTVVFADSLEPLVGIVTSGETQIVTAGEATTYEMTVYNNSTNVANSVSVTIKGDHPFKSDISSMSQKIDRLNPKEKETITFNLYVSPVAKQRYYEFDVQFDYENRYGSTYSTTSKAYVEVINSNVEPIVGIVEYRSGYDSIRAGVEDGIVMYLKNTGTIAAKDVRITLSGFSNTGILLDEDVDTKSIQVIDPNKSELASYRIKAGENATTGVKTLTANVVYIDNYGNEYTKEVPLYFQVDGVDTTGVNVEITNVAYPTSLKPNQSFDVTYTVENNSTVDLDYAEFVVEYPSDFVAKTPAKKVVRGMKAGEAQQFTVTLMSKSSMSEQNYDGWAKVNYYAKGDTSENMQTINSYLGFFVEDSESGSKPKLIIDHYDYGGENVLAGENYTLKLYIENTSTAEYTRNIKVTLTGEESVFTPVDSSSSFFINSIAPGAIYEHEVVLKTKIDASVKIYSLTVKMEYEDGNGNAYDATENPYSETENLSIAVAQPVRLETADLIVPYEIYAGQPFYIEQEFYNMGKSTMYNMMVKVEGVETSEASYFVGNFEAGNSDYYSAQSYAYEEGTFDGNLVYSFEDALGNVSTHEVPFTYTVMPAMEMDFDKYPMEDEMFPEEQPADTGLNKIIIGGILVIAVVAIVIVVRKRRKAKLLKAMEDLDE
ncbi:MAG: hypothetical protein PWP51_850 [Clostridiales bacterium]|nr:hypothetical protein [Clostridiales bacterium]MDN5298297.1 hypothetical protein [Clostridiales bacterium]